MKLVLFVFVLLLGACTHIPHHGPGVPAVVITPGHERPRWCQGYDQRDYARELRDCNNDRCRHEVRRKGDVCGF